MINRFNDEYEFLSNFYETKITWQGITYRNVEAAYQAQKCPERAREFTNITGAEAKKLGRLVPLDSNWEFRKRIVMKKYFYNNIVMTITINYHMCIIGSSSTRCSCSSLRLILSSIFFTLV